MAVEMDVEALRARWAKKARAAERVLSAAVLRDCEAYVPYQTGELTASGTATDGAVLYDAPHARAVYYGHEMSFSRLVHPLATAQWFETAKAAHASAWTAEAKEAFTADG